MDGYHEKRVNQVDERWQAQFAETGANSTERLGNKLSAQVNAIDGLIAVVTGLAKEVDRLRDRMPE